jgi:hypothetical protein
LAWFVGLKIALVEPCPEDQKNQFPQVVLSADSNVERRLGSRERERASASIDVAVSDRNRNQSDHIVYDMVVRARESDHEVGS